MNHQLVGIFAMLLLSAALCGAMCGAITQSAFVGKVSLLPAGVLRVASCRVSWALG